MSCNRTVVADPSAISRQSVGDQLVSDRQPIGDRSATGWRLYLERLFFYCRKCATFWRSVGNRSATGRRSVGDWKLCRDCLQPLQLLGDQSPTSRRPVGDHQKPFDDRFGRRDVLPAATQTSLRPIRPCNRLQPVADLIAPALQPPCDHPKFWSQGGRRPVASHVWPGLLFGLTELNI